MNILWINHEYPPIGGGGATVTKALAREFAALGHSVTVVTAGYTDKETGLSTPAYEQVGGVIIYRLKCKRAKKESSTFFEMFSFLCAAFRFVPSLVKKAKYDIAYIFFGIPNGPLGWYLKKRYNIPYVIALGGGDIPGTQKRFKIVYTLLSPFLKIIWKNAVAVVANSEGLHNRATLYFDKARFAVICNGVDLTNIEKVISEMPESKITQHAGDDNSSDVSSKYKKFCIVTTARILEGKGIQHVVEALSHLPDNVRKNVQYTIIGDGPYRSEIEQLAQKLKVTDYVEIAGMVPYAEVIKKLCEADVFVLTSHSEGMPNSVTEAMAVRLPVIMSNCEGSKELVDGNGFVIEINENISSELAKHIMTLYNDRNLAVKLGQHSYERVCGHFRWEKSAAEFLRLGETI